MRCSGQPSERGSQKSKILTDIVLPLIQRADNAIQRINRYRVGK